MEDPIFALVQAATDVGPIKRLLVKLDSIKQEIEPLSHQCLSSDMKEVREALIARAQLVQAIPMECQQELNAVGGRLANTIRLQLESLSQQASMGLEMVKCYGKEEPFSQAVEFCLGNVLQIPGKKPMIPDLFERIIILINDGLKT